MTTGQFWCACSLFVYVLGVNAPSFGHSICQRPKLLASDGDTGHLFGMAVAIDGDVAIVGAEGSNAFLGAAYIFSRNEGGSDNWGEVTILTASDDLLLGDDFRRAVSISGDIVVVGDPFHNGAGNNSGAIYIFERDHGGPNNWGEVKILTASDAAAIDSFGFAISVSDDTVIVGARADDNNTGSAYVFQRDHGGPDNWGEVTKITASDAALGDQFGVAVFLSGDTAIVGAFADDDHGEGSGSAYIFNRNQDGADNWGEVTKITDLEGGVDDQFGYAVSISGDTAIVGAYSDNNDGNNSGSAFVFQRDQGGPENWGQVIALTASDADMSDEFGFAVMIRGDVAIVGARGNDDFYDESGSAYIFHRNQGGTDNWGEIVKLTASDSALGDEFGIAASISDGIAIVGAYRDDDNGNGSGSAFVFDLSGPCCPGDIDGDGEVGITDFLELLANWGPCP